MSHRDLYFIAILYIFFDSRHDYEGYPAVSEQYEFLNENVKAREKEFFWRLIQQLRSYLKVLFIEMDLAKLVLIERHSLKGDSRGDFLAKSTSFHAILQELFKDSVPPRTTFGN